MARNATDDLSRELGTEVRLEDLHPKTFIRKHLLSEEDERELRRPFDDLYRDVKQSASEADATTWPGRRSDRLPRYDETGRYDQRRRSADPSGDPSSPAPKAGSRRTTPTPPERGP